MPGPLLMTTPAEAVRDGGNVRSPTVIRFQPSLSPAAVAAGLQGGAEQIFTVAGVVVTDELLSVNKPTFQAGLTIMNTRVYSVASQVAISFGAGTASVTPTASEIYQVVVLRGR